MSATKHIGVDPSDYDNFFAKLGPAFRNEYLKREKKKIPDYTDEAFWLLKERKVNPTDDDVFVATDIFGSKDARDPLYFFLKWKNKTLNKKKEIPLRAEAIKNALVYLNEPNVTFPDDYKVEGQEKDAAEYLWARFKEALPPEQKNDSDISKNESEVPQKTKDEKPAKKTIFSTLNDAVFQSEYIQSGFTDRAVLALKTKGEDEIYGELIVYYQDPDGRYPGKFTRLEIRGYMLFDSILSFVFENIDIKEKHCGIVQIEYLSGNKFKGNFISYYQSDPLIRTEKIGDVEFVRSNKAKAMNFLKELKKQKNKTESSKSFNTSQVKRNRASKGK